MSTAAGPRPSYRELLTPSWPVWLAVLTTAASAGLIALGMLGPAPAAAVALLATAAAGGALVRSSAVVSVSDTELRAGRARIPVDLLGRVAVVEAAQMTALRGRDADPRAYLCQRGWIGQGVVVEIADPADAVPYWLVSSRTPRQLAEAIRAARKQPPGRVSDQAHSGQAHSRHTG